MATNFWNQFSSFDASAALLQNQVGTPAGEPLSARTLTLAVFLKDPVHTKDDVTKFVRHWFAVPLPNRHLELIPSPWNRESAVLIY